MKRAQIPNLDDLRALESVSRCGSVRGAADELSLTHGAVSRRVAKLAEELRLPLIEREGRGIRLTPAGEKLSQASAAAFALIVQALQEARDQAQRTATIVLSCERSVAMRWLIPRLSAFQDANPDIAVHLSVGGGALDFARHGVSMALRRLDFALDPSLSVTPLMREMVGPVMSPGQEARFRSGDYVALGSLTRKAAWQDWLRRHIAVPRPRDVRFFDHHFLVLEAASSGLGVALSPHVLATDDVASGKLLAPYGFEPDGTDYGLIAPRAVTDPAGHVVLRDWIRTLCEPLRAEVGAEITPG